MKTKLILLLAVLFTMTGCSHKEAAITEVTPQIQQNVELEESVDIESISLSNIPEFSGEIYVELNNNLPYFSSEDLTTVSFESYSELDSLGRCGYAYANIGPELMPTEDRGDISNVTPSGWNNQEINGEWVENRCHLIAYCLTGENDNEKNLITGTRQFNVDGMLPFETKVAQYIDETQNHVLYRVTPVFESSNLVANGVIMEAYSVEDYGVGICFNVFVYNVQDGVDIDYATGQLWEDIYAVTNSAVLEQTEDIITEGSYIANTNSLKFHTSDCENGLKISEKNKLISNSRENLITDGYEPAKCCNP